jgi:protein phosphatase
MPRDDEVLAPHELGQPRDVVRLHVRLEHRDDRHAVRLGERDVSQPARGDERGLAVREFALGVEALERFVRREPLYRVHECFFAVLALESEPVDPRL